MRLKIIPSLSPMKFIITIKLTSLLQKFRLSSSGQLHQL
jgi:hypothetical protein